jgi:hypothetical protein
MFYVLLQDRKVKKTSRGEEGVVARRHFMSSFENKILWKKLMERK